MMWPALAPRHLSFSAPVQVLDSTTAHTMMMLESNAMVHTNQDVIFSVYALCIGKMATSSVLVGSKDLAGG